MLSAASAFSKTDPSDVRNEVGVAVLSATVTTASYTFSMNDLADICNELGVVVPSVVTGTSSPSAFSSTDHSGFGTR